MSYSISLVFFLGLISFVFILSFYLVIKNKRSPFVESSPTTLTTLGILGTFFGITSGLINFDFSTHQSIDQSIPYFLEGLKTAFITSVFGILSSLLLKFSMNIKDAKNLNLAGPDDFEGKFLFIFEKNMEVASETRDFMKSLNENIVELKKIISGDGDSSIVTQILKFRSDYNDKMNELIHSAKAHNEGVAVKLDVFEKSLNEDQKNKKLIYKFIENAFKKSIRGIYDFRVLAMDFYNNCLESVKQIENFENILSDGNKTVIELKAIVQSNTNDQNLLNELKNFRSDYAETSSLADEKYNEFKNISLEHHQGINSRLDKNYILQEELGREIRNDFNDFATVVQNNN
ncbi:MAG: hypothetical protein RBR08_09770 [Desulforegulaceae bacterium]|nr:hypothetical protein [Desulforegulaceae bacterium]